MKNFFKSKILYIVILALFLGFIDLPSQYQKTIYSNTPDAITKLKYHLGLDLQGGTQLDYKVDLRKVPANDVSDVLEGVKEVITRRVNNLGISEANIFNSTIAGEEHIIVELPGIKDIDEAKEKVGKVIQLEFKEENNEISDTRIQEIQNEANRILGLILAPDADFNLIGQEESASNPSRIKFIEEPLKFKENFIDPVIADKAFAGEPGTVIGELVETVDSFNIVKVEEKRQGNDHKAVRTSHILVAYEGAQNASSDITRSKDDAKAKAEEALNKIKSGELTFEAAVKEYSDDAVTKDKDGVRETPVTEGALYSDEYIAAALGLNNVGDLSGVIESDKGFHIIKAVEINPPQARVTLISISTLPDLWKTTGLTGEHFVHADVQFNQQTMEPYVAIQFNDEGAQLFEEITGRNIDKQVAIFVGGDQISAPRVNEKISGGNAIITLAYQPGKDMVEEAQTLARDLNTGAIPAPINLQGQFQIGASLGQDALNNSLEAGILGLLLLTIYMLLYYRLPGLIAFIALVIYSTILLFLMKAALPLAIAIGIGVVLFAFITVKLINSKDTGLEKLITFLLACIVLFFISFVLANPVVLTLAGVAGIILSIGMAVDANVLIFERIKEELKNERPINSAIQVGFERAWLSIRDSNFSSLITCGILFMFGSSLIRGFALTLSMGILISMFSAITVTQGFLKLAVKSNKLSTNWMFGIGKKKESTKFNFIKNRNKWFGISGLLILLSIAAYFAFGIKAGIDFTGGTLMEMHFERNVTEQEIRDALTSVKPKYGLEIMKDEESGLTVSINNPTKDIIDSFETESTELANQPILQGDPQPVDLSAANIVPVTDVEDGKSAFIIRTKHIENDLHDGILEKFKENLGEFEETRFTTIGPIIGATLKNRAVFALFGALLMIILYIAFAFRKIPKSVNPWRFGVCAIIALIHDVIITLGVFMVLGKFLGIEIDALFVTALLTIIGFSVHDTIVVFDRLRENLRYKTKEQTLDDIANISLNQTLARSINTSVTTLLTLSCLFFLGSESIKYFVFALIVGVIFGTYSSIFTASPILVVWNNWAEKKNEKKKEN